MAEDGTVALRDSKNPTGPVIELAPAVFQFFLVDVRNGTFDLPQSIRSGIRRLSSCVGSRPCRTRVAAGVAWSLTVLG